MRDAISSYRANTAAIIRLRRAVAELQGVVPFVGAGASIPWGLSGWEEFLLDITKGRSESSSVRRLVRRRQFEQAAAQVQRTLGRARFNDLLQEAFGDAAIHAPVEPNIVDCLARLATGPVVTTNFDHVLERAFRRHGKAFDLVLWGGRAQLGIDALLEDYRLLLKLHGDVDDDGDRILTASEYKRHYGRHRSATSSLPLLLRRLFSLRTVVFVGCSLRGDRYLEVMRTAASDRERFAIIPEPATSSLVRARTEFLASYGVTPIWHAAGDYSQIPLFLADLATDVPARRRRAVSVPVSGSDQTLVGRRITRGGWNTRRRARRRQVQVTREWRALRDDSSKLRFLEEYWRWLYDSGFSEDFLKYGAQILPSAVQLKDTLYVANLLNNLHWAAKRRGDIRAADEYLKRALSLIRNERTSDVHVAVLHSRAIDAYESGRYATAVSQYRRALRLAAKHEPRGDLHIRRGLALALFKNGDRAKAEKVLDHAYRLAVSKRHWSSAGRALLARTDMLDEEMDWGRMARTAAHAARLFATRDPQGAAQALDNEGVARYHLGDSHRAIARYLEALRYEQDSDDRPGLRTTLLNIGWLHFDGLGSNRKAPSEIRTAALHRSLDYYAQAAAVARTMSLTLEADVLVQKALVTAAVGNPRLALGEVRRAVRIFARHVLHADLGLAFNNRGRIHEEVGRKRTAIRSYRTALAHARKAQAPWLEHSILYNLATAYRDLGDVSSAKRAALSLQRVEPKKGNRYSERHLRLFKALGLA